jgi:hypothetical protein
MTVLVYEDNESWRKTLGQTFQNAGIPAVIEPTIAGTKEYFAPGSPMPAVLIADLSAEESGENTLVQTIRDELDSNTRTYRPSAGFELVAFAQRASPDCRIIIWEGNEYDPSGERSHVWGSADKTDFNGDRLVAACLLGALTPQEQRSIENRTHIPVSVNSELFRENYVRDHAGKEKE